MAKSAECRCDSSFTCGYCLRNAPVYFFTTSKHYFGNTTSVPLTNLVAVIGLHHEQDEPVPTT